MLQPGQSVLAGCPGCLPAHASLLSFTITRHKETFKYVIPLPSLHSHFPSILRLSQGSQAASASISTQKGQAVPSLTWSDTAWPISHRWLPHATFVRCALPTLQKARAASTCHPQGGWAVREKNHLPSSFTGPRYPFPSTANKVMTRETWCQQVTLPSFSASGGRRHGAGEEAKVRKRPKQGTRDQLHPHTNGTGSIRAAAHSWPEPCEVSVHEGHSCVTRTRSRSHTGSPPEQDPPLASLQVIGISPGNAMCPFPQQTNASCHFPHTVAAESYQ